MESKEEEFYWACRDGNLEKVKELSNEIDDINWGNPNDFDQTGLFISCSFGMKEIVEYLIAHPKINVNKENEYGRTSLNVAFYGGNEEIVEVLIKDRRVDVNKGDDNGWTPLWGACYWGYETIVKIFVKDHRVDVDKEDNFGRTPLWIACFREKDEIVKILLANRKDIDTKKTSRFDSFDQFTTAANIARKKGFEQIAKLIDEYDQNPMAITLRLRKELSE